MGKIKAFIQKHKVGLGVGAGALGLGAVGIGATRLLRGHSKSHKRSGIGRLKTRVQRLTLKIKEKQLKRKLFKEELRL